MTAVTLPPLQLSTCQDAWEGIQPMIEAFHRGGYFNKLAGTVVVLDPRIIDRPKSAHMDDVFESAILFQGVVYGTEEKEIYTKIARSKAFITWKTGLPSSIVQQQYPYLYQEADTLWGGSWIDGGGLIVAFSGVQQVYDEAISQCMAAIIRSMCRDDMTDDDRGLLNLGVSFVGDAPELIPG